MDEEAASPPLLLFAPVDLGPEEEFFLSAVLFFCRGLAGALAAAEGVEAKERTSDDEAEE